MTNKEKFLLCQSLNFFAFGYVLNGYTSAAIFLELIILFVTYLDCSVSKSFPLHFSSFLILFFFLSFSCKFDLESLFPGFNCVLALHISSTSLLIQNSFVQLRKKLIFNTYVFGIFLCLAFILPEVDNLFYYQRIAIVLLIFCPLFVVYFEKCFFYHFLPTFIKR